MGETGLIFDIERFSTEDGPGIRTSVFFKGCNMRCPWCHNAEGLDFTAQLRYDASACVGCGACVPVCPKGAQVMGAGGHALLRERCDGCMRCVPACFGGALQTVGKPYTAPSLCEALMEDAPYFRNSGGGVTATGGEPLCQAAFVAELFGLLKAAGVRTAVETNLSLPWETIAAALEQTDLVLFDLKHMDRGKHLQATGLSNRTVLENARALAESGKPMAVRTPVIPGFNDTPEDIRAIARFLAERARPLYYELLPYHPLGSDKARMLGMTTLALPLQPPDPAAMQALGRVALTEGLHVKIGGRDFGEENRS